jgi:hypothetical protein
VPFEVRHLVVVEQVQVQPYGAPISIGWGEVILGIQTSLEQLP